MSLHYLEVNAMMAQAQDYMSEAHNILARHIGTRQVISEEGYDRLNHVLTEVEGIAEKLRVIDMKDIPTWPVWALDEITIKDEFLKMGSEVLKFLSEQYLKLF